MFRSIPDCPGWRRQDTIFRIGGPRSPFPSLLFGRAAAQLHDDLAAEGGFNVRSSQHLSRRTVIADANNNDIRCSDRFLQALGYAETSLTSPSLSRRSGSAPSWQIPYEKAPSQVRIPYVLCRQPSPYSSCRGPTFRPRSIPAFSPRSQRRLDFGKPKFCPGSESHRLCSASQRMQQVAGTAFRLLAELVANAGRIVTREELQQKLCLPTSL